MELARYFGPLHRHATTPIPRIGLEEVHGQFELIISKIFISHFSGIVVYNDASRRPDPSAFTKLELWHSDVITTPFSYDLITYNSNLKGLL